jgi:NAD(P)-dependent dehydrogenase (short-subunit alcohol dehydrogenase family)
MSNSLTRSVAFITGGNRGIGFETARQLGALGLDIVIGARSAKAGEAAVATLAKDGIAAQALVFDVLSPTDRQAAYDYFDRTYGCLDVLVNNAGVHLEGEPMVEAHYTASTTPEHVLRDTMEANFFSVVAVTDTLLPLIRKSAAGRIVNLSTILASLTLMSDPGSPIYPMKSLAYDTSKVAINSYTIHLAHELRDTPIKVNSAHPGWVLTDMGGRHAQMTIADGAKTSVALATLAPDGPSGSFIHLGEALPW